MVIVLNLNPPHHKVLLILPSKSRRKSVFYVRLDGICIIVLQHKPVLSIKNLFHFTEVPQFISANIYNY